MIVCVKCRREMRCEKNGVRLDYGNGHVYAGDRFACPDCGAEIVRANDGPDFDPEHTHQDEYLDMKSKP